MLRDGERAVSGATQNRYRDRISGMFTRAIRLGLVVQNPARGIRKVRESTGRVVYLTAETERAIHDQLPPALRPLVTVAVNTGLRWSEQAALRWVDVDLLVGVVTVRRAKNGHSRQVPINSTVARVLVELGAARPPHSDPPGERVRGRRLPHRVPRVRGGGIPRPRGAAGCGPGSEPARGVHVARAPAYLREPPGDGRRRSADDSRARGMADPGAGHALCPPQPDASARGRGTPGGRLTGQRGRRGTSTRLRRPDARGTGAAGG
jgi:integrase